MAAHEREKREDRKGEEKSRKTRESVSLDDNDSDNIGTVEGKPQFCVQGKKKEKMFGSSKAPLACFQNMLRARVYDAKTKKKSQMSMQIYA